LFSVLKRAYGKEIDTFIRTHINHITKVEFFLAYKAAHLATFTKANMEAGFRGTGLVPFNPDAVISKLDVNVRTTTPTSPPPISPDAWVSQTPHNPVEAVSQSIFIKNRIRGHQGSSPTPILVAVDQLAKGTQALAYSVTLLSDEVRNLQKANQALAKRRRAKKSRVRLGEALSVQDAHDIIAQDEAVAQATRDLRRNSSSRAGGKLTQRRCGRCGNTGHNARTCDEVI
jgi:hypothetical protein